MENLFSIFILSNKWFTACCNTPLNIRVAVQELSKTKTVIIISKKSLKMCFSLREIFSEGVAVNRDSTFSHAVNILTPSLLSFSLCVCVCVFMSVMRPKELNRGV